MTTLLRSEMERENRLMCIRPSALVHVNAGGLEALNTIIVVHVCI